MQIQCHMFLKNQKLLGWYYTDYVCNVNNERVENLKKDSGSSEEAQTKMISPFLIFLIQEIHIS